MKKPHKSVFSVNMVSHCLPDKTVLVVSTTIKKAWDKASNHHHPSYRIEGVQRLGKVI